MDPGQKAALKSEYKLHPPEAGIFRIVNRESGKIFIGSSMNLPGIFNRYRAELRTGGCRITDLQSDWHTYGEDNFAFEVVEALEPRKGDSAVHPDDLKTCTDLWLEELQPYGDRGYNRKATATGL